MQESQELDKLYAMTRWIKASRQLLIPVDCAVILLIAFALPHHSGVAAAKFWLYFFPITCVLWLVVTSSFQTNQKHISKLIGFAGVSASVSLVHVPLYFAFTFRDTLGQI